MEILDCYALVAPKWADRSGYQWALRKHERVLADQAQGWVTRHKNDKDCRLFRVELDGVYVARWQRKENGEWERFVVRCR